MKSMILTILVLGASAGLPSLAAEGAHEHDVRSATLQLDNGRKWETDAPLRKSMHEIRQSMAAALPAIHASRMTKTGYASLAKQVEGAVNDIVAQCKLPPAADAQLHLVIGDLLVGVSQMAGKIRPSDRKGGAIKVVGALDAYEKHFDDPGFAAIAF